MLRATSTLCRFFAAAAVHSRPQKGAQRLALEKWARHGRSTSVLTPRDIKLSRHRGGGGAATAAANSRIPQQEQDAMDAESDSLYDGVSRRMSGVPLDKVKRGGESSTLDQSAATGGEEEQEEGPKHGTYEWERMMIRRRATRSLSKAQSGVLGKKTQAVLRNRASTNIFGADSAVSSSSSSSSRSGRDPVSPEKAVFLDPDIDNQNNYDDDDDNEDNDDFAASADDDDEQQQEQSRKSAGGMHVELPPPDASLEERQLLFDDLLERTIVLFAKPHLDALRTYEVHELLHRAVPGFCPTRMFKVPDLMYLLRNSRYLKTKRGRWTFVRQFDPERDAVTVKLEPYRYQEAPEQDLGARSVPEKPRKVKFFN